MPNQAALHQFSLIGGEISPSLYARVDVSRYGNSLKTCRNAFVKPEGGVSKRAGTRFIAETKFHDRKSRLVEFQFSTQESFVLEFGHEYMRVIINGGLVLESGSAISEIIQADQAQIAATGHGLSDGDTVYVSSVEGMTEVNQRQFLTSGVTSDTARLSTIIGDALNTTGFNAYTGGGIVSRVYEIATPYQEDELFDIKITQSADVMYLAHPNHAPRQLSRFANDDWRLEEIDFGTDLTAPQITSGVWSGSFEADDGSTIERYVVTAVDTVNSEESIASEIRLVSRNGVFTAGENVRIGWSSVAGATDYNIYKQLAGVFGFIGTTDGALTFEDDNITPDTGDTPPENRNPFADGNNPGAVAFFEDRLAWAGSDRNPQTSWLSQTSNYDSHALSSPPAPDDAVEFTITARQLDRVQHILSLRNLILMTNNTIWAVSGQGDQAPIEPASIYARPQLYYGTEQVEPIIVGDSALFVENKNHAVRDLYYEFSADGYVGSDLSIMARHLFDGRSIVDWSYARAPDEVIWAARDDGVLLGLTYVREHQIQAWHRHDTLNGKFESVASVDEDDEDRTYFTVARASGDRTFRYIECLESRFFEDQKDAFFVDCGLRYKGDPVTVLSGLWHLEGYECEIYADGNVLPRQTVVNGSVTIARAASTVSIGLPFVAELETLELYSATQTGPLFTKNRKIGRVFLQVDKTRGLCVAHSDGRLEELKERQTENYGSPIDLISGVIEIVPETSWSRSGGAASIKILSEGPLPFEILSVMPEVSAA